MNTTAFDFSKLKKADRYFLMTSSIVPRPIAVVSTLDKHGQDNLAPFSYFNAVSSEPPCLMFSMGLKKDGSKKDTLRNIETTKEFVVHICTVDQLSLIEKISEELPFGVSEREQHQLTLTPSTWIKTPRIKEFPVAFECLYETKVEIGDNTIVFGKILGAHIQKDLIVDSAYTKGKLRVDTFALNPLARLGHDYAKISKV